MTTIAAPVPLSDRHRLDEFDCAAPALTSWLRERARKNHAEGASRCFVACVDERVVAYYALAAGAVTHDVAPGRIRRNMPNPIPVIVLGRLAVHRDWCGQGIGAGLLKDAIRRTAVLSMQVGIRAMLCHAIDESAKGFYLRHGFIESPLDPLTLMLSLERVAEALGD